MKELFKINKLHCAYSSSQTILSMEDIVIPKGKLIFVVGVSGRGKSTFLETLGLMNQTIQPGSSIRFYEDTQSELDFYKLWDANEDRIGAFRRQHFSFIFQKTNLMSNFLCGENMLLPALFKGKSFTSAKKEILLYMRQLDLPPSIFDQHITTLSGGQRQRLAFIRAMVADFSVLFGDEPTGNLDATTSRDMMIVLKSYLQEYGKTGILVSHDLDLASEFGDMIIPIELDTCGEHDKGIIHKESILFKNDISNWSDQYRNYENVSSHLKQLIA